mgnify:CR=1 FL=1
MKILSKYFDSRYDYILFGFVTMFCSMSLGIVTQSFIGRYLALVAGFFIIFYSTIKNCSKMHHIYIRLAVSVSCIYCILFFLSFILNHSLFFPKTNMKLFLFHCINAFYVIAGVYLGRNYIYFPWRGSFPFRYIIPIFISFSGLLYFLLFKDAVRFLGATRSASDLGNPVGIAYIFGILAVVAYCATLFSRNFFQFNISFFAFIICLVNIVFVQTRGAMLYLCLTLLVLSFIVLSKRRKQISKLKLVLNTCLSSILGIGLISLLGGSAFMGRVLSYVERFSNIFKSTVTQASIDTTTDSRLLLWQHTIELIKSNYLFGMQFYSDYPHNSLLEIVSRFGLFGLILYLFMLYKLINFLLSVYSLKNIHFMNILFLGILFYSFLQHQTSLSYENNRAFYIGLGYCLGFLSIKKSRLI